MCYFDQTTWSCSFWKWGNFRQPCTKVYVTGETCGLKLVYNTNYKTNQCKLCDIMGKKRRCQYKIQQDVERWNKEGNRRANIEQAESDLAELEDQTNKIWAEHEAVCRRLDSDGSISLTPLPSRPKQPEATTMPSRGVAPAVSPCSDSEQTVSSKLGTTLFDSLEGFTALHPDIDPKQGSESRAKHNTSAKEAPVGSEADRIDQEYQKKTHASHGRKALDLIPSATKEAPGNDGGPSLQQRISNIHNASISGALPSLLGQTTAGEKQSRDIKLAESDAASNDNQAAPSTSQALSNPSKESEGEMKRAPIVHAVGSLSPIINPTICGTEPTLQDGKRDAAGKKDKPADVAQGQPLSNCLMPIKPEDSVKDLEHTKGFTPIVEAQNPLAHPDELQGQGPKRPEDSESTASSAVPEESEGSLTSSDMDEQRILKDGLTSGQQRVAETLMAAFDCWWNRVWNTKACQSKGNDGAGASGSSARSSRGNNTIPHSKHKRKRRADDDDNDEPQENGREDLLRQGEEDPENKELVLYFACPYYQRNPARYGRTRSCKGPGWKQVHRVKYVPMNIPGDTHLSLTKY